ncbi:hypothetical protein [Xanthomonas fragariae]|uniref:hypothetical protein n=1 Tax=Xanthomonas fragariae TaxID=48664 RepID=UPI0022AAFD1D|nr:hypothetical protein [Xanthomonas fragariae]WAT15644.1 hypothetical protein OZ429_04340 [Xanthomonas fragariae]
MNGILRCRAVDGEALSALMVPLGLRGRDRTRRELELMERLTPVLELFVKGCEIARLKSYAQ